MAFARLGEIYEALGRDVDAVAAYLRAASLTGEDPAIVSSLSGAFQSGGLAAYWAKRLELVQARTRTSVSSPLALASIYVHLHNNGEALAWLERAHHQHLPGLPWIHVRREWAPLRSDARFRELLRRMNLPSASFEKTGAPARM